MNKSSTLNNINNLNTNNTTNNTTNPIKTTTKLIKKHNTYQGHIKNKKPSESLPEPKKDIARLIDYYRLRVENFEKERVETLERLEQLKLSQEEQHRMEWENKRRKEEIIELQNIISSNNEVLNKERRKNLHYQFELESRNIRSNEDRRRLKDIMKLAEPVEQTYKLFQDKRPNVNEKFTVYEGFVPEIRSVSNNVHKNIIFENKGKMSSYVNVDDVDFRTNNIRSPLSMVSNDTNYTNNKSYSKSRIKSNNTGGINSVNNNSINNTNCNNTNNINNNSNSYLLNNTTQSTSKLIRNKSSAKVRQPINNNFSTKKPLLTKTKFYSNTNNTNNLEYRISPSDEKQQIVRTIILPREETSQLQDEINFLKQQTTQTRQFYEDQLMKTEEAKNLKDEETRLQLLSATERIEQLMKRNQKLESLNYEITKDYLHLKYDSSQNEKQLFEELELVKLQNESLSSCVRDLTNKHQVEKELSKNDFERKTRELSNVLRNQIRNFEDQNSLIKEQYKQVQKVYANKVKSLEDKLAVMTKKYKLLETRRNLEYEGFLNELALIRKRMISYENYIYKLKCFTNGNTDKTNSIKKDLEYNEDGFKEGVKRLEKDIDNLENQVINSFDDNNQEINKNMNNQGNEFFGFDHNEDGDDQYNNNKNEEESGYNQQQLNSNDYNQDMGEYSDNNYRSSMNDNNNSNNNYNYNNNNAGRSDYESDYNNNNYNNNNNINIKNDNDNFTSFSNNNYNNRGGYNRAEEDNY